MIKVDRKMCTGCGACKEICPTGCIYITEAEYGFTYPLFDMEKSINCHLCENVCPIVKDHYIYIKILINLRMDPPLSIWGLWR